MIQPDLPSKDPILFENIKRFFMNAGPLFLSIRKFQSEHGVMIIHVYKSAYGKGYNLTIGGVDSLCGSFHIGPQKLSIDLDITEDMANLYVIKDSKGNFTLKFSRIGKLEKIGEN